jgi:signal recognition particle receptor subunit beta
LQLAQVLQEERLLGVPVLILANKQDLPGALSVQEIRLALRLEELGARHWEIRACSARTGKGADIDWLVQDVCQRIFPQEEEE